jgi:hypothetical protein
VCTAAGRQESGCLYMNVLKQLTNMHTQLKGITFVFCRGCSLSHDMSEATKWGAMLSILSCISFEFLSSFTHKSFAFFRGSAEATRQAHNLIAALIKDPDVDILQMLPKSSKLAVVSVSSWDKSSAVVSPPTLHNWQWQWIKNSRINFTSGS